MLVVVEKWERVNAFGLTILTLYAFINVCMKKRCLTRVDVVECSSQEEEVSFSPICRPAVAQGTLRPQGEGLSAFQSGAWRNATL